MYLQTAKIRGFFYAINWRNEMNELPVNLADVFIKLGYTMNYPSTNKMSNDDITLLFSILEMPDDDEKLKIFVEEFIIAPEYGNIELDNE